MKINLKMALVIAAAALLTACGSSDDTPAKVTKADTTSAATATTVAAVVGQTFTFQGGVPELGTTANTTVAFSGTGATPTFTITSAGEGTASGVTEFGSCNFRVNSSTFAATHPLAVGKAVFFSFCSFTVNTAGAPADGTIVQRTMTFQLGSRRSLAITISVSINSDGVVVINNVTFGTTTTGPVTGGGS